MDFLTCCLCVRLYARSRVYTWKCREQWLALRQSWERERLPPRSPPEVFRRLEWREMRFESPRAFCIGIIFWRIFLGLLLPGRSLSELSSGSSVGTKGCLGFFHTYSKECATVVRNVLNDRDLLSALNRDIVLREVNEFCSSTLVACTSSFFKKSPRCKHLSIFQTRKNPHFKHNIYPLSFFG